VLAAWLGTLFLGPTTFFVVAVNSGIEGDNKDLPSREAALAVVGVSGDRLQHFCSQRQFSISKSKATTKMLLSRRRQKIPWREHGDCLDLLANRRRLPKCCHHGDDKNYHGENTAIDVNISVVSVDL
jgi:hypothetical protein